ncbi:MAG TPA: multidrug ABC transporter substrate-binding protein [Rhodobacteraceae bacterium]|jgi:ABC-type antimicrobial peptide transport system permease subunit|nr:ABC transporter permease [Paracoccaceae bacterium]HBG99502.1 multidrug ABC transporter substrate-binding protein [Paracoccaceae bacterium]
MLIETIRLALSAIRRNALRSFLTILGVIIGVAAVVAMVTIGNGATARINAEIDALGSNVLFARPGQLKPGASSADAAAFALDDVAALAAGVPVLDAIAPVSQATARVVAGGQSRITAIIGTTGDFLVAQDWPIAAGRGFSASEGRAGRAACLLGDTVADALFGGGDALGRSVRIGSVSCTVIGLLAEKGESTSGADRDDLVVIPIRAFQRRIAGNTEVGTLLMRAAEGIDTARVEADIAAVLRERRGIGAGRESDFTVGRLAQIVEAGAATSAILTGLLAAVAAVSLLVGGIGIMNIMLVSVTERTREIGIRLAVGAREGQVLLQFLVEAVVLSVLGGGIGIVLGLGIARAVSAALDLGFAIDAGLIGGAFVFSAAVGIVFGYLPARRAARLDPVEALRHP